VPTLTCCPRWTAIGQLEERKASLSGLENRELLAWPLGYETALPQIDIGF
jgi:hypothetical protein